MTSVVSCSALQGINIIVKKDESETQNFLQGSNDIPIMTELKKAPDEQPIGFDSSSGSIISSSYFTNLSLEQIADFYNKTLPQLGWIKNKTNSNVFGQNILAFKREKQNLAIEFFQKSPFNIVKFLVTNQV